MVCITFVCLEVSVFLPGIVSGNMTLLFPIIIITRQVGTLLGQYFTNLMKSKSSWWLTNDDNFRKNPDVNLHLKILLFWNKDFITPSVVQRVVVSYKGLSCISTLTISKIINFLYQKTYDLCIICYQNMSCWIGTNHGKIIINKYMWSQFPLY